MSGYVSQGAVRSQACTFTTTFPNRMDLSGLMRIVLLLPVRLFNKPSTAIRSNIGVAPWSLAAILLFPLPLGIVSGLVSAIAGFSSSSFGSRSHPININGNKVNAVNDERSFLVCADVTL